MRAFTVVSLQPPPRDGLHLAQRFKGVRVKHLRTKCPIEAFDVRVLIGLAGLNVVQRSIGGVIQPVEVGTFPVASPVALALGATPLRPEQSLHYSAGLVVEPVTGLKATVDVYRIDIDGRIVLSDNFTGGRLTAILAPLGASGARFFTNAIDTKTQGVDLTVDYRVPMSSDSGRLDLTASFSHNTTQIVSVIATPPQLEGFDNTLFSRIAPNDLEFRRYTCAQPKDSFRFAGTYMKGRLGMTARENLYGEYCSHCRRVFF